MAITWSELGDQLFAIAKVKKIPLTGQFELTSRCNLKCKMCYVCQNANDKSIMARERSAKEWINLAKEAREAGMLYLLLTGGEILLRQDFKQIYEEICKMGFNIELYTNATLVTPEIAKWLGKIPPSKLEVTLYGASPETYEKVCGNSNAFFMATRGIDLLLAEGIKVGLKTTVIGANKNDFYKIDEFAEKRGLHFGVVNYISPRREGSSTNPDAERLSASDLIEYEKMVETHLSKKFKSTIKNNILSNSVKSEVTNLARSNNFQCTAGNCAFWVTWDGKMTPCGLMDNPAAFPFEIGFLDAWKELQHFCSKVPSCAECEKCSFVGYCMACPARLKNETGHFDEKASYLCESAKLRSEYYKSLNKLVNSN